jgi:hypothetical protein
MSFKPTARISGVGVACVYGLGDESIFLLPSEARFALSEKVANRQLGVVPHFDPALFVTQKKSLKLMNRASTLGIAAARLALNAGPSMNAGGISAGSLSQAGLFMSVGMSGGELSALAAMLSVSVTDEGLSLPLMGEQGLSRINPLLSFHVLNNMPLCHTSIELGIHGPHAALYTADTAGGLRALARAAQCILRQEAPLALAGGADSPLDTINLMLSASEHPAEGAAMMIFSTTGDIEWLGLSEHTRQSEAEALRSLIDEAPLVQVRSTQTTLFGETSAASASLWVARTIALLRGSPIGSLAAIFAHDEAGVSVALLRRCQ